MDARRASRTSVLSDGQWARTQPLLPSSSRRQDRPFRDDRRVVESIITRIGNRGIQDAGEITAAVQDYPGGASVMLTLIRGAKNTKSTLTL
ncbi:transposase [Pseudarthrobacter sp. NIBRBAC000502770]|nr:transposase [Pseudarthrobacter sp. NIBRBAC000502770]